MMKVGISSFEKTKLRIARKSAKFEPRSLVISQEVGNLLKKEYIQSPGKTAGEILLNHMRKMDGNGNGLFVTVDPHNPNTLIGYVTGMLSILSPNKPTKSPILQIFDLYKQARELTAKHKITK